MVLKEEINMESKEIKEKVQHGAAKAIGFVRDAIREGEEERLDDEYNTGRMAGLAFQREEDLKAVINYLLDQKKEIGDLYQVLSKYFKIDSIKTADALIKKVKASRQITALRLLYEEEGMTTTQFKDFSQEIELEKKLLSDDGLLDMPPKKLKLRLDK